METFPTAGLDEGAGLGEGVILNGNLGDPIGLFSILIEFEVTPKILCNVRQGFDS